MPIEFLPNLSVDREVFVGLGYCESVDKLIDSNFFVLVNDI